jgi:DNA-binding MurR/RpiR family transcriptional regulator
MAIIPEQKPVNVVVVEASGLEQLADSVMSLTPPAALADASISSDGIQLASFNGNNANAGESEGPSTSVQTFFDLVIDELSALRTRAEIEAIERAAVLILDCESRGGRVHVTGIGKSEHIARFVASLLSSTGTPAYFLHATECIHGSAGQVCPHDIAIAISNSGTTPELLSAIETLRKFGTRS